jgi:hypothetical protein
MRSRFGFVLVLLTALLVACPAPTPPGPPAPPPPPPGPPAPPSPPSPPSPPPPPAGPSSETLIDQAVANGEIDTETALVYKVFAAFRDVRLPGKFQGDDSGVLETDALWNLNEQFDTLSSANQTATASYLLRPSNTGSWMNPTSGNPGLKPQSRPTCRGESSGWTIVNPSSAKVNVWYRFGLAGQKEKAQVVSNAIENEIWPNLIGSLGFKEPLDDTSIFGCYGGDKRLDVYLVSNVGFRGLAQPEGLNAQQAPVYIMLNTDSLSTNDALKAGVTHEFMHAIQFSYRMAANQNSYGWLRDASANWAIDQVYGKTIQLEQEYADCFTSTPELSLDDRSKGHCKTQPGNVNRDYGAYLFFQFIARTAGAATVKKALENTVSETTSLGAVDTAISGGFKDQWWKFAKTLWNQDPIDTKPDSFKQWDALSEKPDFKNLNGDLSGAPEAKENLETELNNLSMRFYRFKFADANTRSLLFYNGFFDQIKAGKAVKIIALWKDVSGAWQEEDPSNAAQDWSQHKYVGLCRDIKNQRASELVIIIANGEKDPGGKVTAGKDVYVKRNNMGCYRFEGTVNYTEKHSSWSGLGRKAIVNMAFELMPGMTALDAKHPLIPDSLRLGLTLVMALGGTDYNFQISYSSGSCSRSFGPASFPLVRVPGTTDGVMQTNAFKELEANDPDVQKLIDLPSRAYVATALDNRLVSVTVSGRGCSSPQPDVVGGLLLTNAASNGQYINPPVVKPDGTMQGNFKTSDANFDWTFSPRSEP